MANPDFFDELGRRLLENAVTNALDLQAESKHMATYAQLQELRCEFYKKMSGDLRWIISTIGLTALVLVGGFGLAIKFLDVKEPQRQVILATPVQTTTQEHPDSQ